MSNAGCSPIVERLDTALVVAIVAVVVSGLSALFAGASIVYAHRADQRALSAETRATAAEERQGHLVQIEGLERLLALVREVADETDEQMRGGPTGITDAIRARGRLQEAIGGFGFSVPLQETAQVAIGSHDADFVKAAREIERLIAAELRASHRERSSE